MKTFSYIYAACYPYLVMYALYLTVKISEEIGKSELILMLLFSLLFGGIAVAVCIICNITSFTDTSVKKSSIRNIAVKLCHIPAHLILFLIFGGMMNPFLFMASWIPLTLSVGLLSYSGLCNIGACISLFRKKKCRLVTAVMLCLLSFVYVLDIISGIVQLNKSKEKISGGI